MSTILTNSHLQKHRIRQVCLVSAFAYYLDPFQTFGGLSPPCVLCGNISAMFSGTTDLRESRSLHVQPWECPGALHKGFALDGEPALLQTPDIIWCFYGVCSTHTSLLQIVWRGS